MIYFLQGCVCQTTSLLDKCFKETHYCHYLIVSLIVFNRNFLLTLLGKEWKLLKKQGFFF